MKRKRRTGALPYTKYIIAYSKIHTQSFQQNTKLTKGAGHEQRFLLQWSLLVKSYLMGIVLTLQTKNWGCCMCFFFFPLMFEWLHFRQRCRMLCSCHTIHNIISVGRSYGTTHCWGWGRLHEKWRKNCWLLMRWNYVKLLMLSLAGVQLQAAYYCYVRT